jgi:hypothetical protein
VWAGTLCLLFVLALGGYTPLLRILYDTVPGFDRLRSHSKFSIPAAVLLCLMSAYGFDTVRGWAQYRIESVPIRRLCGGLLGFSLCLAVSSILILRTPTFWSTFLGFIGQTREAYVPISSYSDPSYAVETARWTSQSLGFAALSVALFAALLWWLRQRPKLFGALAVLAIAEVFVQAAVVRPSFPVVEWYPKAAEEFSKSQMTDGRMLDTTYSNSWMLFRKYAAWGYDPFILRRYAEVMAVTQGVPASEASYDLRIRGYHPLLKMLRCQFVASNRDGMVQYGELPPTLPHLLLVNKHRVLSDRDSVLEALLQKNFDPSREVILEQQPHITTQASAGSGSVKLLAQTTDSLEIEANLTSPQILLITDSYANGWRAEPLEGSSQKAYQLLPANWTLRAVPLQAGHHRLRVVYDPPAWRIGKWISGLALLLYLGAWAGIWWQQRRRAQSTVDLVDDLT